jgi:23S rRNA pseudouridine2605 synthase
VDLAPNERKQMNSSVHRPEGERLQKVLASAGLGSRRDCEELILTGRIDVEGVVVDELGIRVDPHQQTIRCDGTKLNIARQSYWILNKPVGVVCTNNDPSGRTKVVDLIPSDQRLFTVGRLDRTSSGLILVTNDGEFANKLAHPRYRVDKTYLVTVAGKPTFKELTVLTDGVRLAEGVAKVESVKIKRRKGMSTELEIVLREGKNREIRRILAKLGYKVLTLHRIAIASIRLSNLPIGECRRLTAAELKRLSTLMGGKKTAGKTRATTKTRKASPAKGRPGRAGQSKDSGPSRSKHVRLPEPQTLGQILGGDDDDLTGETAPPRKRTPRKPRSSEGASEQGSSERSGGKQGGGKQGGGKQGGGERGGKKRATAKKRVSGSGKRPSKRAKTVRTSKKTSKKPGKATRKKRK